MAIGAPLALAIGADPAAATGSLGAAWVALVGALCLADARARRAARPRRAWRWTAPRRAGAGGRGARRCAHGRPSSAAPPAAARRPREVNARLDARRRARRRAGPRRRGRGRLRADAAAARRGRDRAHLGALARAVRPGLEADRARRRRRRSPITPNVGAVKDEAIRLFARDAMFGLQGAAGDRRRLGVPRPARARARHGPAHHRLEAVGPPRQAARQGVPHRAQPPGDLRHRYRPADVRAAAGRAAHRPRDQRRAADGLRVAEARRPGRLLRLRRPAAPLLRRRRPARTPSRCCSGWPPGSTIRPRRPTTRSASPSWARRWSGAR